MSLEPHVRAELDELGLDEGSYRAILLLPLVEVAWADGAVQPREREAILAYGEGNALLAGGARDVLEGWLATRPDHVTFARGRSILVELANATEHLEGLDKAHIDDVVAHCTNIAESAGGLFDRFFTASDAEREAIRQIAMHIARLSSYYEKKRR
ncbi:MAG: hypothetical protein H6737_14115 [Alphaproteobacteria bacterium]|nr:hypothetical protein [Alphaproteobacteria bacterium]